MLHNAWSVYVSLVLGRLAKHVGWHERGDSHAFYVTMESETTKDITAKVHIGHAIQKEMARQGRNVTWLAAQIHMTDRAIYKIYEKESLNTELVRLISNALEKNFFALYCICEQNGEK